MVMIEGEGGSGKSTLVRKMCHDWAISPKEAKCKYFIHDFYIVLLFEGLKLGKLGLTACLNEMIGLASDEKRMRVYDWLEENSHRVFIIFDGMDGVSRESQGWKDVVKVVKEREKFVSSHILLTSRVSECIELEAACDLVVRNLGFRKENALKYVETYF